jgi:hypothetical protein
MAASQAAYVAEKAIGHDDNAITSQDVSGFPDAGEADRMNALVWMGKNKVDIGTAIHESPCQFQDTNNLT